MGLKSATETYEKVPERPADFLYAAILASKRFWWLPVIFCAVEIGLSFLGSILSIATIVVAAAMAISILGLVAIDGWVWVGVAGMIATILTSIFLIRGVLLGVVWRRFSAEQTESAVTMDHIATDAGDGVSGYLLQTLFRVASATTFATSILVVVLLNDVWSPEGIVEIAWFALPCAAFLVVTSIIALVMGLLGTQIPIAYFAAETTNADTPLLARWRTAVADATELVLGNVELVYRVFLASILLLMPALLLLYFSAFVQSLAIEFPALMGASTLIRSVSSLFFTAMFALAVFYYQGASFWLYAFVRGEIDAVPTFRPRESIRSAVVMRHEAVNSGFDVLLPEETPNIFELEDVVGRRLIDDASYADEIAAPDSVLPNSESEE